MTDGPDAEADAEPAADEESTDDAGGSDATRDEESTDELVARVAALDVEAAAEVEALRERVAELEAEVAARDEAVAEREATIEELQSKLKRARADFQNYKKRAKGREEELRERATEDLVERLLDVRDNLVRALEQDDDVEIRDGVEATLATFDRILDAENVSAIEPDDGDDVDPERHEVVHRTESPVPEGAIADVYRPGYEMAGRVLRPAQVTVSEGPTADGDEADSGASDAASED